MTQQNTTLPTNADHDGGFDKPSHRSWIVCTFFIAYLLTLSLSTVDALWIPDILALTLIYWTVRHPRHIGMTIAFLCGILSDIHNGSVLGQQALSYTILSYSAYLLHRRLPWFSLMGQAFHIFPLLLLSQIIVLLVRLWFDGLWPGFPWFLQSLSGAILWPVISLALSWPERKASQHD